jgi:hypothetical protein
VALPASCACDAVEGLRLGLETLTAPSYNAVAPVAGPGGRTGCWARHLGRPVGPPWPTRGLPGLSWPCVRTSQRWAARPRRPAGRLGLALRRPAN